MIIKKSLKTPWGLLSYSENTAVVSEGATLLFIHGNSSSSESFQHQFSDPNLNSYRLIALDLPGHGDSEVLQAGSYSLPVYAKIIRSFVEELCLQNVILLGHSLGGHIALEALSLEGPWGGFVIWGTPPLSTPPDMNAAFRPNPRVEGLFKANVTTGEIQGVLESIFENSLRWEKLGRELFEKTHVLAREELASSVGRLDYTDELKVLRETSVKGILFDLERDQIVESSYFSCISIDVLEKHSIKKMPWGHSPHVENSIHFNEIIFDYLNTKVNFVVINNHGLVPTTMKLL